MKQFGCDVEIIKYKPFQMITWKSRLKQLVMKTPQQKVFQAFRDERFILGGTDSEYDCIVVGSDQVWNPNIIRYDDFWFTPKVKYKHICSYAASFGKVNFQHEESDFIGKQKYAFQTYDVLTVREETGKSVLNTLGINSEVVCDPTLLYYNDVDFYKRLSHCSKLKAEKSLENRYILVYSLEKSEEIDRISQKIKNETGYSIVSLHPMNSQTQKCDLFISDTDPYDFLYLIEHCETIVTNSFHGLAFSFIFRKKVYCINHSSLSSRQSELISKSGFLTDAMSENVVCVDCNQDNKRLTEYIDSSFSKLHEIIKTS